MVKNNKPKRKLTSSAYDFDVVDNLTSFALKEAIVRAFDVTPIRSSKYEMEYAKWEAFYRGFYEKFHIIRRFDGKKLKRYQLNSLNTAKFVVNEKADLLFTEKVIMEIPAGSASDGVFNNILDANDFYKEMNGNIEKSQMGGTAAIVEYLTLLGDVKFNYLGAPYIFPISAENSKITECVFASSIIKGGISYLYLNGHFLDDDGNYVIRNVYYDVAELQGNFRPTDPEYFGVKGEVLTGSRIPRFQIIKPNIENNLIAGSPMGISCYANAINILMAIDIVFDSFINEFILGRKRVIVGMQGQKFDKKAGRMTPYFDPKEEVYFTMTLNDNEASIIKEIDLKLRTGEHEAGMRMALNLLSMHTGFGLDYFSWDKSGGLKTATEVISEDSDLYQSLQKERLALTDVLRGMIKSVYDLLGWKIPLNEEILIHWDDSIITDKGKQQEDDRILVANKVLSKRYYLRTHKGMTDKDIDENFKEIQAERELEEVIFPFNEMSNSDDTGGVPAADDEDVTE